MNRRDIVIGGVILLLLSGVIYWRQTTRPEETKIPETLSVEDQLEEKFKFEIPEDVDKTELKDVAGVGATAIATRKYEDGKYTHTALVDIADPEVGTFYQGWIAKGEEGSDDFSIVSTGKLKLAKGGWMIEFESSTDYSDYDKILITQEKFFDNNPEEKLLEGSF
jgi:hypothetical protein